MELMCTKSDFFTALRRQEWLRERTRSVSLYGRFLSCEIIIRNKRLQLFLHVFGKSLRVVGSVLDPKMCIVLSFLFQIFL